MMTFVNSKGWDFRPITPRREAGLHSAPTRIKASNSIQLLSYAHT
jgi:hypothetical protein